MAAFLANVGVNSSHAARSPLFADGTFELLPIPEPTPWRPPMLRMRDVSGAHKHAPASWFDRAVHLDPDLKSDVPTYGDNCRRAGRAFSLRRAKPGDIICFLARLRPDKSAPAFHLVGCLEIDEAICDVIADPGSGWWDCNAHVRRARASCAWDSFWVFRGSQRSRLLGTAASFGKHETELVFGASTRWPVQRTELQTIGSLTRAVRRIEGSGEQWLRTTCLS